MAPFLFVGPWIAPERAITVHPRVEWSGGYIIVQNSFLAVIGVLPGPYDIKSLIIAKAREFYIDSELMLEIAKRESGFDPKVCNKKYGCRAGQGLFQLIPTTVGYCESKLKRKIDPFNAIDNTDCAVWLLANEGIRHWQAYSGPY